MYQYEYETVSCNLEGWGFGAGYIYSIEEQDIFKRWI